METTPNTPKRMLIDLLASRESTRIAYSLVRAVHPGFPSNGSGLLVRAILGVTGAAAVHSHNPQIILHELMRLGWTIVPRNEQLQPGDVFFLGSGQAHTVSLVLCHPDKMEDGFIALDWAPEVEDCWSRRVLFQREPIMLVLRMRCAECGGLRAKEEVLQRQS
jgi:hypothetical protein